MIHYLFGYGSLINQTSRSTTGQTGETYPVRINGLKREWNVPAPKMGFTGVGVIQNYESMCNGVLTKIEEKELSLFDEREIIGSSFRYERVLIPSDRVENRIQLGMDLNIWCYVAIKPEYASQQYPIAQSYIDVILAGCLDYGEDFANEFVKNTGGWDFPWVNDRSRPIYVRSLSSINYEKIDQILAKNIPEEFSVRRALELEEGDQ